MNDLSSQCVDQRIIFTFRISDDNVILRNKESIGDLSFGSKGFTGSRSTKDQAIRIFQFLAVHHDHVVAECI